MRIPTYYSEEDKEKMRNEQNKKAMSDYKRSIEQITVPPRTGNFTVKLRVETSVDLYMFDSDGVLTDKRMREKAKDDIDYPKYPKFLPKYDKKSTLTTSDNKI